MKSFTMFDHIIMTRAGTRAKEKASILSKVENIDMEKEEGDIEQQQRNRLEEGENGKNTSVSDAESLRKRKIPPKKQIDEYEVKVKKRGIFELQKLEIRRRVPKWYRCKKCEHIFETVADRNGHMSSAHAFSSYTCEVCNTEFENELSLKTHMYEHDGKKKVYKCDICDQSFMFKSFLLRHKKNTVMNNFTVVFWTHVRILKVGKLYQIICDTWKYIRATHFIVRKKVVTTQVQQKTMYYITRRINMVQSYSAPMHSKDVILSVGIKGL